MILFLTFLLLLVGVPLHASPIVTIGPDVFLSRQVLTPDCEYYDYYEHEVVVTETRSPYDENDFRAVAARSYVPSASRGIIDYEMLPNPCYLNKDGSPALNPPDYCFGSSGAQSVYVPEGGGLLEVVASRSRVVSSRYFNFCTHDCDPPPVVVPEPSTVTLAIIGLLFLIGWGVKNRNVSHVITKGDVWRWQFGYYFPKAGLVNRWPKFRLDKHRLTLIVGSLGFIYLDWDPEFVCQDCLHSRTTKAGYRSDSRLSGEFNVE